MNLEKKLEEWVSKSLISREQANAIVSHEKGSSPNLFTYTFLTLGVSIVTLGILAFIAANWENLSGSIKIILDFLILIIVAFFIVYYQQKEKPLIRDRWIVFFQLFILASIGVISPVFSDSYEDRGNGIVFEKETGLFWQKCQVGLSGEDCSIGESHMEMAWEDTHEYCKKLKLGGRTWRMPERIELSLLVTRSQSSQPAIDTRYFPNTKTITFWTGTEYAFYKNQAWNIGFNDGHIGRQDKGSTYAVRCVSGVLRTPKFAKNKDGTVVDKEHKLVWQECTKGRSGLDCKKGRETFQTWQEADQYCNQLKLSNRNWRLPEITELELLIDFKKESSPPVDEKFFPNTNSTMESVGDGYWSRTTPVLYKNNRYYLSFFLGSVGLKQFTEKTSYVRCVSEL